MRVKGFLITLLIAAMAAACQKVEHPVQPQPAANAKATAPAPAAATESATINYTPISPQVFVPAATINGWIQANPINTAAISQHRWDLWSAMTAPSGQSFNGTALPIWETWYDTSIVFKLDSASPGTEAARMAKVAAPKSHPQRRFTLPVQFLKTRIKRGLKATPGEQSGILLTFNRFTQEMKDGVWTNNYWQASTLDALNASYDQKKTPLAQRVIAPFKDQSIMMKPVFWIVSGTTPTPLPYWNGTGSNATSNPTTPTPDTWKQCVLVDPTGTATNQNPITCNGAQIAGGQYQVVQVSTDPTRSGLYGFALTAAEIADIKALPAADFQFNQSVQSLQPGDLALFVGGHVSTREIDNWTWQTFWWEPNLKSLPSQPPNAQAPPASVGAPWSNYASCTAYYMVTPANDPKGENFYCYNPYLETGLTGGLDTPDKVLSPTAPGTATNCMTCHRAASWPSAQSAYNTDFYLDPANATWFTGATKTDFSWAMVNNAH